MYNMLVIMMWLIVVYLWIMLCETILCLGGDKCWWWF